MTFKRRVRGDRSFRKLLRQLPDEAKGEMAAVLDNAGDQLLSEMQADVPRRTGRLASGLSKKLLRSSLRLRVGIIGKPTARRLFYSHIVEGGRKAGSVMVRRRIGGTLALYRMRVRAMAARPFVFKRRSVLRATINRHITSYWERVLTRAAAGVGDE